MQALINWVTKPASIWQFWLPGSGVLGGFAAGLAIQVVCKFVHHLMESGIWVK